MILVKSFEFQIGFQWIFYTLYIRNHMGYLSFHVFVLRNCLAFSCKSCKIIALIADFPSAFVPLDNCSHNQAELFLFLLFWYLFKYSQHFHLSTVFFSFILCKSRHTKGCLSICLSVYLSSLKAAQQLRMSPHDILFKIT